VAEAILVEARTQGPERPLLPPPGQNQRQFRLPRSN
jgi:hypothetical protein